MTTQVTTLDSPALDAIHAQLTDGEDVREIRTLHRGRATGAIAVTTRRLLVVDPSKSTDPEAETVLFSEVKDAKCRRSGLRGIELTVRTRHGRRYHGLESRDRASAKRFVAALDAEIENPAPWHLRALPAGSKAARPPIALERLQGYLAQVQRIVTPLLPVAALLFLTGVVSQSVSVGVFAVFASSRAFGKLTGALATRSRGQSGALRPSQRRSALPRTVAE